MLAVMANTGDDPATWLGVVSLMLNVVQTCFLAWLAVYARLGHSSSSV